MQYVHRASLKAEVANTSKHPWNESSKILLLQLYPLWFNWICSSCRSWSHLPNYNLVLLEMKYFSKTKKNGKQKLVPLKTLTFEGTEVCLYFTTGEPDDYGLIAFIKRVNLFLLRYDVTGPCNNGLKESVIFKEIYYG